MLKKITTLFLASQMSLVAFAGNKPTADQLSCRKAANKAVLNQVESNQVCDQANESSASCLNTMSDLRNRFSRSEMLSFCEASTSYNVKCMQTASEMGNRFSSCDMLSMCSNASLDTAACLIKADNTGKSNAQIEALCQVKLCSDSDD